MANARNLVPLPSHTHYLLQLDISLSLPVLDLLRSQLYIRKHDVIDHAIYMELRLGQETSGRPDV